MTIAAMTKDKARKVRQHWAGLGLSAPEGKGHPCDSAVILRGFEQLYMGIDADERPNSPEKNPSVRVRKYLVNLF